MKARILPILKWLAFGCLATVVAVVFAMALVLNSEAGTRWLLQFAEGRLNEMPGLSFSYGSAGGTIAGGVRLEQARVTIANAGGENTVALDRLAVDWDLLTLLDRRLSVSALTLTGLEVGVTGGGEPSEPVDIPSLIDPLFMLPVSIDVGLIRVDGFDLSLDGQRIAANRIETGIALDEQRLEFSRMLWRTEDYQFSGEVRLQPGTYPVRGQLEWLVGAGDVPLEGSAAISGTLARLEIEHRLSAPLVVETAGSLSPGLLDGSAPAFELRHSAADVSGAFIGLDILQSLSGTLDTSGTLAAVNLDGDLTVGLRDFEPFDVTLAAEYGGGGLDVENLRVISPLLDFQAGGSVDIQPSLAVEARWALNRFDYENAEPALTLAGLQGTGSVELSRRDGQLNTTVELDSLDGRLNDYPLDTAGRITVSGGGVENADLTLRAGNNALQLAGRAGETLDLRWSVDAPALDVLLPGLQGRLSGSGMVGGTMATPEVNGMLQANALRYQEDGRTYALGGMQLEALYRQQDSALSLQLSSLEVPLGGRIRTVSEAAVELDGRLSEHSLETGMVTDEGTLTLVAEGGYSQGGWSGRLERVDLRSDYGNLALTEPAALSLAPDAASVDRHCWTYLQASLCLAGEWESAGGYRVEVTLDGLPLAMLNNSAALSRLDTGDLASLMAVLDNKPAGLDTLQSTHGLVLPANTFIDGTLAGRATVTGRAGGPPSLQARINPAGLRLGMVVEQPSDSQTLRPELQELSFDGFEFDVARTSGGWSGTGGFQVYQMETSGRGLQGSFTSEVTVDNDNNLAGSLEADFGEIAWVDTLVPGVTGASGTFQANAELDGSIDRPLFVADLVLEDAGFRVPEYGLDISDLNVTVHSGAGNEITLSGSAVSGEGQLALESRIISPFLESRRVEVSINGDRFQVINLPDTQARIDPDLDITYVDRVLDISGSLALPQFDLNIQESQLVSTGGVGVSRDAVVVEAPPERGDLLTETGSQVMSAVPVNADVLLTLGDDVRFRGYGLDARLSGQLEFEQSPDRPVLAYGEVTIVEGAYEIYGQRLNAEDGKLLFFGNPLNPVLDIRAYRETDYAVVGVHMNGTIRNIQGRLYSTPNLPEAEILSILVTGKSFNNINDQEGNSLLATVANLGIERGQGLTNRIRSKLGLDTLEVNSAGPNLSESTIGVGKYITPDLFLRYDVGLFEKESTLSMIYNLNERLRLKVETGVTQSVDLTYTVEQDRGRAEDGSQ